jgi:ABC-2 type transport system permease protein
MSKTWQIAWHEYQRNVFKKSFILVLFSVPFMMAVSIGSGLVMESLKQDEAPVGIVDTPSVFEARTPPPVRTSREPVDFIHYDNEDLAGAALRAKEIQAYFLLPPDFADSLEVNLVYLDEPGENAVRNFYDYLQINLLSEELPEVAYRAAAGTSVTVRSQDGKREIPSGGPTFGLMMPLMISLAFLGLMLINSGYLMSALADEKENRTIEVLVTTISPSQLVGGKVLGIVAIGLTQLVAWGAVTALAIFIAKDVVDLAWLQNMDLEWEIIWSTIAIAVPAYVLASALMAAIGVAVTSSQEGQSISSVFIILHMIPLYISWMMISNPNGPIPTVLSLLPFTSLMTVSFRNLFSVVPLWQVAASAAVQTIFALAALWIASRSFRLGLLRYGQRLSLRKIFQS